MADDVLFTVDASQILAKLHFAGLQQIRHELKGGFIVNTGILNDDPNGIPDKLGKTRFDLKNSSGTYQLGYVVDVNLAPNGEYDKEAFKIQKQIDDLDKFRAQINADAQSKKLLSSNDAKDKKNVDEVKKRAQSIVDAAKNSAIAKSLKLDAIDFTHKDDMQKLMDDSFWKGMRDELNKALDEQQSSSSSKALKALDAALKNSSKIIEGYMVVFAGADNVNINENSIGIMQVSNEFSSPNSKGFVKLFEIQPIDDAEKEKIAATAKADPKNAKIKVCFYVQYTLNVEK